MAQGIEEIDLGSNERQPPHEVLLVSAGASHSVALLCKHYLSLSITSEVAMFFCGASNVVVCVACC